MILNAASFKSCAAGRAAPLTLLLLFPRFVSANIGNLRFISPVEAQSIVLTEFQLAALTTYNDAANKFAMILSLRRAQINLNQQLPNLPGQALYLARINMMSAYKDLTDAPAIAERTGGPL